jgi:acyl-CoA dehydrogenase
MATTKTNQEVEADTEAILNGLGTFVDHEILPIEEEHHAFLDDPRQVYDAAGGYSQPMQDLMRRARIAAASAGYYNMCVPTELGGGGQGPALHYAVWEYLSHRYGPARVLPYQVFSHWAFGPSALWLGASSQLKAKVLDEVISGQATTCFALSEPDAGSDAWSMTTRAERDGDEWVISGIKQWISNSPIANYAIVFAVTNHELQQQRAGGISAFVVPTTSPGYRVDSVIKLFGDIGGNEAILSFDGVRVPVENLLGDVDRGFTLVLAGVSAGRMYNAGYNVGLARWALERATEYAKDRRTFGHPISEYQGVSFMLADCAIDIYAAKTMSVDCAARMERGEAAIREMNMIKAFTTEMCCRVYDRCMQVHGGMGLTNELRLYDGWHYARIARIADGSAEIMRRNIARALLKGDVGF